MQLIENNINAFFSAKRPRYHYIFNNRHFQRTCILVNNYGIFHIITKQQVFIIRTFYFSDVSSNKAFYAVIAGLVTIQGITVSNVIYQRRRVSDMLRTNTLQRTLNPRGRLPPRITII